MVDVLAAAKTSKAVESVATPACDNIERIFMCSLPI
jgi:hypothetical protein